VLRRYCNAMIEASRELGYAYSVVVTDINRARLYKRLFSVLGYHYDIVHGLRIPEETGFDGLPHLLASGITTQRVSPEIHIPTAGRSLNHGLVPALSHGG